MHWQHSCFVVVMNAALVVFLVSAHRHILQHHSFPYRSTVRQDAMHCQRPIHPSPNAVFVQLVRVANVISVRPRLTGNDDAEHIQDSVTMAVERRPLQHVAISYAILYPSAVQLIQRQSPAPPERIHNPDILVKNNRRFHSLTRTKLFHNTLGSFNFSYYLCTGIPRSP